MLLDLHGVGVPQRLLLLPAETCSRNIFCWRAEQYSAKCGHSLQNVEQKYGIKASPWYSCLPTKMSGEKHPSDMPPHERDNYLRRFPRMAWWLRQVDGNHPDYPGMSQSQQLPPSPPLHPLSQQNILASPESSYMPLLTPPPSPFNLQAHQQGVPRPLIPLSREAFIYQSLLASQTQNQSNAYLASPRAPPPPSHTPPSVQAITVSIPLNTGIVGGLVTRRELHLPSNLAFADFYSRICANMDIQPKDASVGYKYHNDKAKDPPRQLSDVNEYNAMMNEMVRKVLAARSKNPVLFLHNLVRHQPNLHF